MNIPASGDLVSNLPRLAAQAGVRDTISLKSCMRGPASLEALEADTILARTAGVVGTPSLIVNGQLYKGTQRNLKKLVDALLSESRHRPTQLGARKPERE